MKKDNSKTKEKILKVSGQLFAQRGYYGVSMRDIAAEMDFTKSSLYYHFESKDKLVEELMKDSLAELKKELRSATKKSKLPFDTVFNIVKTLLDFKISHPELSLLVSMGISTDDSSPILRLFEDLRMDLTKFIRDLIGGVDLVRKSTFRTVFSITTTILGFVLLPLHHGDRDQKELAEDFTNLLITGSETDSDKK